MSLAEELLADLEDDDEDEIQESEAKEDEDDLNGDVQMKDVAGRLTLEETATLTKSVQFNEIMEKIRTNMTKKTRTAGDLQGPVEADPEYVLIVEANNIAADIDNEIAKIFNFAKDIYTKRFPELETLVVNPLDYLQTARELGNNILNAKNNKVLEAVVSSATIMVVSVTASTTQGVDISASELAVVGSACEMALHLHQCKLTIFEYVESRMAFIAPNLSAIIGSSVAAKLMGAAGGLTSLSKMPSGHVSLLGQQRKTLSGFSQKSTLPHTGFVYYSELVQSVPPDLRRKVGRIVGDKCTLAARVDAQHESIDGRIGDGFREDISRKIDKFQEAAPVKAIKAHPIPLEAPKKKRGGRRVRKQKERYAVTELRKQANRMNFGELGEDLYQSDLGYDRGNIGKGGVGHGSVRAAQIDKRTEVRVSQTLKRNMQKQNATWGGTTSIKKQISGTASSVAFTPLQGLEIVNPSANEARADEANQKYFSTSAAFVKVKTPAPSTT